MDVGLTVGDSLDRLEATLDGFDLAELSIGESAGTDDFDTTRLEEALTTADADLCVHLPYDQVVVTPVPELNDAISAYLSRLLAWAGSVGARKAVMHATARDPHDTSLRPLFTSQLTEIGVAADDAGVELVLENVGHQRRGYPLSVVGDLAREADTAVCFDVGHAYMEDGHDGIDRFLSSHGDLVSHLHVHDARTRGDTHIPIGAGEIDYDVVGSHLAGFDETVAVEVFTDDDLLLRDSAKRARSALEADTADR